MRESKLFRGLFLLSIFALLALSGCAKHKTVCFPQEEGAPQCNTFIQYGLASVEEDRNPDVQYEISVDNVILAVILSETIVAPIIIVGWYLYEPIGPKPPIGHRIPGVR